MKERIVILGGGESGAGAAVLAKKEGFEVFLSDFGSIEKSYKEQLKAFDIAWEEGQHSEELILNAQKIIKSPGIPDTVPIMKKIMEKDIPVISEIEFAAQYTEAYLICITGSNGKTTTATLCYELMKHAGYHVGLAGNIGKSFAFQVATQNFEYYVLELSSFQLDGMYQFKANTAILLNISPDHLDRYHNNFQEYIDSKFRILQNQDQNDYFIYCEDDKVIKKELKKRNPNAKTLSFSIEQSVEQGACLKQDNILFNQVNEPFDMSIKELSLKGKHNLYNSMAAALAANINNIKKDSIREKLSNFKNIEHRLEYVLKVHGISFINDSKATNVNSTWYALESMDDSVIWIAGGVDKGNDYEDIKPLVKQKVKAIVCLGIDNSKLHEAFGDIIEQIIDTKSMEEAIKTAYLLGKDDDTVLLSPACASFDLFDNYEDRGRQFKKEVRNL